MNRFKIAVLCLALTAGCGGSAQPAGDGEAAAGKEVTFIYGARVIPGDGSAPIEEATMLIENGMITLRASGLQKLRDGVTTMEEVLRETVK